MLTLCKKELYLLNLHTELSYEIKHYYHPLIINYTQDLLDPNPYKLKIIIISLVVLVQILCDRTRDLEINYG